MIPERKKWWKHSNFYHWNFVPQIPEHFIKRYTKKAWWVFDPFLWSATTAIEAESLGRNIVWVDIQESLVNRAKELMDSPEIKKEFFVWDSKSIKTKNIIKTVLAAIKVCNRNDDFDFIFVGDGELYPIATKMVKDNNLQKRIKLVGWQNDILNWLDKFDVFLLFSKWEGLPLSILDAMAYGLPIIASDIKGNRELVNKDCGILIDPNDIESLVEVILNFENNFLLMKEMGNNSRKYVSKNFSFENFIGSYKKIYEEV